MDYMASIPFGSSHIFAGRKHKVGIGGKMILADYEIEKLAIEEGMISPFDRSKLNPFGYDLTLAEEFLMPHPQGSFILNPLDIKGNEKMLRPAYPLTGEFLVIPVNSFALGRSVEKLIMPKNIVGICLGRSSYARCGIITNVTPLEAGWEGVVTIEIANLGPWPVMVYVNKGITQVQFHQGNTPRKDYVAKGGRYQGQTGITLSKGI
mgnify:CR=1 FL=1